MAIAEAHLAAEFGSEIVDHRTYVLASDGDLMEGISHEAIALAGHLRLNKLIVLFDDNGISIDGPLSLTNSVDQVKRFEAAGWAATRIDGHDPDAIADALAHALQSDRPSLIACRTTIGFGAPTKAGTEKVSWFARSAPTKLPVRARRWVGRYAPFDIPIEAANRLARPPGADRSQRELPGISAWPRLRPTERAEFERRQRGDLPGDRLAAAVLGFKQKTLAAPKEIATRAASEQALEVLTPVLPEMIGGSADLTGSNNTRPKGMAAFSAANRSRPLHPLRRPRTRHGGRHERDGAAWRPHSLFGHLPGVLGLLPASDQARGPDGRAGHSRDDP